MLKHIGFLAEPRLEHRRSCEATIAIYRWRARPRAFHLPPTGSDEDEPAGDSPRGDLSLIAEHTGDALAPISPVSPPVSLALPTTVPVAPTLVPQTPMNSAPLEPSGPIVHYPLCQGLPGSHRDDPYILSHDSFICRFTGHTC